MSGAADDICIVGVGARTSLGDDAPSTCAAVRAGVAAFEECDNVIDGTGEPVVGAFVRELPWSLQGHDRARELASNAIDEAFSNLVARATTRPWIDLFVVAPNDRPGWPVGGGRALAEAMTNRVHRHAYARSAEPRLGGHAAGLLALREAANRLRTEPDRICAIVASDSFASTRTLEWLSDTGLLKNRSNRWGMIPGEGAVVVLLTTRSLAVNSGYPVLGTVQHVAGTDASDGEPSLADTAFSRAFARVFAAATDDDPIDEIVLDLDGNRDRTNEYGVAAGRFLRRLGDASRIQTPADALGDLGATTGAAFVILAVAARRSHRDRQSSVLVSAGSRRDRGAAIIARPPSGQRGSVRS